MDSLAGNQTANLQKFRRENRQIMQEYSDKIDADTRQLMTEQFREGEQEAEAVAGAEPAASVPDVHFSGEHPKNGTAHAGCGAG